VKDRTFVGDIAFNQLLKEVNVPVPVIKLFKSQAEVNEEKI